eukprot:768008-Hanusia_phi.AAC.2
MMTHLAHENLGGDRLTGGSEAGDFSSCEHIRALVDPDDIPYPSTVGASSALAIPTPVAPQKGRLIMSKVPAGRFSLHNIPRSARYLSMPQKNPIDSVSR